MSTKASPASHHAMASWHRCGVSFAFRPSPLSWLRPALCPRGRSCRSTPLEFCEAAEDGQHRGLGENKVKRDYFTLTLVLAGVGFLGYALLSLRHEQSRINRSAPTAEPVTDPEAVLPLILRELDQKIRVEGGRILVTEKAGVNTYLLPVSSQWLVQCGAGVSIQLEAAATGPKRIAGNEVNVELFDGLVDRSACAVIATRVAARLQDKLGR